MARIDFSQGRQFAPGIDVELYPAIGKGSGISFRGTETGQFVSASSIVAIIDEIVRSELAAMPKDPYAISDPFLKDGVHLLGEILGLKVVLKMQGLGGVVARLGRTKFISENKKSIDMRMEQRFAQRFITEILPAAANEVKAAMQKVIKERIGSEGTVLGSSGGWGGKRISPPFDPGTLERSVFYGAYNEGGYPTVIFGIDNEMLMKAVEGGRSKPAILPYWMYLEWGHGITIPGRGREPIALNKSLSPRPFYDDMIEAGKKALHEFLETKLDWESVNRKIGQVIMEYIRGGATTSSYA